MAAGFGAATYGGLRAASAGTTGAKMWKATGTTVPALTPFDNTMKAFMQARDITAGQLAVTYKGRLVLARGYRWSADSTLNVQPTSLFRIASLSKSLTAAAIVKLVQDGKLTLGTRVATVADLTPPAGRTRDPRIDKITLQQLLQHTAGWDRTVSPDPQFNDRVIARALGVPMELRPTDVVTYMSGQPLDFDPGTKAVYSNFGYHLAGRVIERASGLPYATYVRQKLLAPLGITRMAQGWSIARHPGEVPYVSQYTGTTVLDETGATVAAPYGTFSMRLMEAHGGWIASAVDMVRWASVFDKAGAVLGRTAIGQVFAQPGIGVNADGWYYGLGWQVRPVTGGSGRNTWHTGSLPGTYTLLVRTYHGMSWAALFNQRDDISGLDYGDIDAALWTAAGQVTSWPTTDLYSRYF
ncbi:serine hydrolase domain-containing protein [Actinoplanes oblitus]|uniref:Serine hydrolase domain-containing protein n=1 Tax=Actinoplanes oblitus TaxID=3040509 RepID=A0ABY8W536_9ACTN|nr:serine hydrolase domain-containing protein [Actinoplanes oblitus]WIM92976.1 serine hydrolase domain-containing protein [Actinoplanes oblitus]